MRNYVLGGAQFGRGYGFYERVPELSKLEIAGILQTSFAIGIREIDAAQNYLGLFEKLEGITQLTHFDLSTKFKYIQTDEKITFENLISTLDLVKKPKFCKLLVHNWHELEMLDRSSALNFLKYLRKEKICEKIGISVYETDELVEGVDEIDFIQAPLSFFNRSFLYESIPYALLAKGVEFQARSIFHQGTLLNPTLIRERFPEHFRRFDQYCLENGLTNLEGALSVYDNQELFTSLVIGVASELQLREITHTTIIRDGLKKEIESPRFLKELADSRLWT